MSKKPTKPDWRSRPRPSMRKPDAEKLTVTIEVALTETEKARACELADKQGLSLSGLLRRALREYGTGTG